MEGRWHMTATATMEAKNTRTVPIPQVEFEMVRNEVQKFATELVALLQANPSATFHLQIEAIGKTPTPNPRIGPDENATVSIHQFPP
jgi:hypothetical protein